MIDPKYADLPGIAYDQPDVYETDDIPDNEPLPNHGLEDSESIEKINTSTFDAFHKFKDKHIICKGADFSNSIGNKTNKGYASYHSEWNNCYEDENETLLQKYRRIQNEIQELLRQIDFIKKNHKGSVEYKSLTDIFYQIDNVGKDLESMGIENLLNENSVNYLKNYQEIYFKELKSQVEIFKQKSNLKYTSSIGMNSSTNEVPNFGQLKYQMIYFPDKAKVQDIARISHLEKRLGYLENLIGFTGTTSKFSQILRSQGITKSLEKLMENAYLLNTSQIDILENKVTSLIHKMDNIIQKKSSTTLDPKSEKIVLELYELIKQSESCSDILPKTIDRMLSLSNLHQKAAEFMMQLKELEDLHENIQGSLNSNKIFLDEMQLNFSGNLEIITNDITSLNTRILKLKI